MVLTATPALAGQATGPGAAEVALDWGLLLAAPVVLGLAWRRGALRLGSAPGRLGRDPGPLPWWFWLVAGLCVFMTAGMASVVALVALTGGGGSHPADAGTPMDRAWSSLAGFGVAGVLGLVLARRARALAPSAGLGVTWRGLLAGSWWLVAAAPIVYAGGRLAAWAYRFVTGLEPERLAHEVLREIAARPGEASAWVQVAAVVVAAPVAEEIAFRGFLQTAVLRLTRSAWAAVLGASLVFTLAHGLEPYAMATIFALSVCLGVAYERRGNLGTPIAMHALFNAVNVGLGVWG